MSEILFQYSKVAPTTWVYLSSLLTIGLFFKFGRFWSVRNLDLILLILLAPGLLAVHFGQEKQRQAIAAAARSAARRADSPPPVTLDPASDVAPAKDSGLSPTGAAVTGESSGDPAGEPAADPAAPVGRVLEPEAFTEAPDPLAFGRAAERLGFIWLLGASGLLLVRLLLDTTMVRRPLLEPNLTAGGLTFIGCSLFAFLMANVIYSQPTADDLQGPMSAEELVAARDTDREGNEFVRHGPGYALLFLLPSLPTVSLDANIDRRQVAEQGDLMRPWRYVNPTTKAVLQIDAEYQGVTRQQEVRLQKLDGEVVQIALDRVSDEDRQLVRKLMAYTTVAKLMAILSHLAVVLGMLAIGFWHFNNIRMGIGAATLYLMLPYTSQMTGRVDHVLPAALLVLAVLFYRRPLTAGVFVGLATGVVYYPLFLLPLWLSFYWHRGLMRFTIGVVSMLVVMVIVLMFVSTDAASFWLKLQKMFGLMPPQMENLRGIWGLGWPPFYRYPVLAAFIALCGTFAIWPAQKNLGTLLSCSAVVMVATQFWHGYGGGAYMAWYLPLLLLTIFRPNLEDRIALSVLGEGWFHRRRRSALASVEIAA